MKTLIKNGKVINVFTKEIEKLNILIEDDKNVLSLVICLG